MDACCICSLKASILCFSSVHAHILFHTGTTVEWDQVSLQDLVSVSPSSIVRVASFNCGMKQNMNILYKFCVGVISDLSNFAGVPILQKQEVCITKMVGSVNSTNERCWKCYCYIACLPESTRSISQHLGEPWLQLYDLTTVTYGCRCNLVRECRARSSRLSWLCQSVTCWLRLSWLCQSVTCWVRSHDHNMSAHCSRIFLLLIERSVVDYRVMKVPIHYTCLQWLQNV